MERTAEEKNADPTEPNQTPLTALEFGNIRDPSRPSVVDSTVAAAGVTAVTTSKHCAIQEVAVLNQHQGAGGVPCIGIAVSDDYLRNHQSPVFAAPRVESENSSLHGPRTSLAPHLAIPQPMPTAAQRMAAVPSSEFVCPKEIFGFVSPMGGPEPERANNLAENHSRQITYSETPVHAAQQSSYNSMTAAQSSSDVFMTANNAFLHSMGGRAQQTAPNLAEKPVSPPAHPQVADRASHLAIIDSAAAPRAKFCGTQNHKATFLSWPSKPENNSSPAELGPATGTLMDPPVFGKRVFQKRTRYSNKCVACGKDYALHTKVLCGRPADKWGGKRPCNGWTFKLAFAGKHCSDCPTCVGGLTRLA